MTRAAPRAPRRKPSTQYHHGHLRQALLDEAVRTIGAGGVEALTLRAVGERLGVSRTALYRHFADKSALLAAVAREGFQRFADDLRRAWTRAEGTEQGLALMGTAYVDFAVAHPAHYRVMFTGFRHLCAKDPELEADAEASFDVLVQALQVLQEAGLVRRDELRAQAYYVWATVHGLAMLAIDGFGPASASADHQMLVSLGLGRLLDGLGRT